MSRRELREHIFRLLFRVEFHSREEMPEQGEFYSWHLKEPDGVDAEYILEKVKHIIEKLDELDERINGVAVGWKTSRMSKVDLTLLRLALFEILYDEDVPTGVAINEAVELAKRYGTDESSSFINGILAKFA
ncbi:MAG TPA: transcription antitermination factor NusB [Candidatus Scybalocola faecigallinarum]|uniref:Transcription antitermination protein NusB n=1 Tax=Candidatus Scybalocola faecigallinarum TaxID=2840941 RepID=A0A9D1F4C7_9FIRM|nr:transcription antitermination factor NusB [Candidatus Scybalocola faecigallinarum]